MGRLAQGQASAAMVSMQAPLQAPDVGRETMLTDIWETPEVLRGLLHLAVFREPVASIEIQKDRSGAPQLILKKSGTIGLSWIIIFTSLHV